MEACELRESIEEEVDRKDLEKMSTRRNNETKSPDGRNKETDNREA